MIDISQNPNYAPLNIRDSENDIVVTYYMLISDIIRLALLQRDNKPISIKLDIDTKIASLD